MGESISSVPHFGIKQYYVNTRQGAEVVKVAFNSSSSATTRQTSSAGNGVIVNIGTKNLATNADLTNAINKAIYNVSNVDQLIRQSQQNILNAPEEALKAASTTLPNEEVMGLLLMQ